MGLRKAWQRIWTKARIAIFNEREEAKAREDRDAAEHVERASEGIKDQQGTIT